MASLKKNFLYNISITLANYIAALIVFPYVSRCLGVELMGKTSFAINVVAYFSLFALLRSEERRVGKECRSRWSPYH